MPPIQLLIKPASGSCNLRCRYCFYEDEMNLRSTANYGIMSLETLEAVVEKSLAYADRSCGFTFQGGEPTLAGLDFFRELIRLEEKHNRKGVQISNAIQTNGFGQDEAWAAFFAENHFLVGVSLDGNKYTHDACRVGPDGGGTFEAVMKTIALFERFSVEYNILTVVNRATAERADKIYAFYAKNHFRYQQYIACLDPMGEPAGGRDYSLTPERYGDFMIRLFDLWYLDLQKGRQPYIRQFENYVALLLGYEPESCEQRGAAASSTWWRPTARSIPATFMCWTATGWGISWRIRWRSWSKEAGSRALCRLPWSRTRRAGPALTFVSAGAAAAGTGKSGRTGRWGRTISVRPTSGFLTPRCQG